MSMSKRQAIVSRTRIVDLTDDVLKGILFRLPLKSLHRSKCVSKSWNDMALDAPLGEPIGILAGLFYCDLDGQDWGYVSSRVAGVLAHEEDPMVNFDPTLSFLSIHPLQLFIGACNGLVLCLESGDHWLNYYVCNPMTKTWASVPMPESVGGDITHFAALDFDPSVSPHFRIIRFMHRCEGCLVNGEVIDINHFFGENLLKDPSYFNPPEYMDIEIFSSETGRWVKSTVPHGSYASCSWLQSITLNGILYKLANPRFLLRYNMRDNGAPLPEIPLPDESGCATYGCLGISEGFLNFAHCDVCALKIWQLRSNDDGALEWAQKHEISYDNLRQLAVQDLGSEWEKISHRPAGFLSDFEIAFLQGNGAVAYNYDLFRVRRLPSIKPWSVTTAQFKNFTFTPCLHDPSRILKSGRGLIKFSKADEKQ